jgi:hypothetical protein
MLINGKELEESDPEGVRPGTVISVNGETIRVLSEADADKLLAAAQFIQEHFRAD